MSALSIEFRQSGIYLPALALWLDPHHPQTGDVRVFVSHAHADHTAPHREVILSEATAQLMRARVRGERREHVMPFGERREFVGPAGPYALTLLPAGHILGSAMSLVECQGQSLLYTGDFKLRCGRSAEPCDPRRARGCDVLIMETTFGRPRYRFPPTEAVLAGVIRFCREALDNDETPVLLGYSLGKSQELLQRLAEAGLPVMLHDQVFKLTGIYEQLGQTFPAYERYDAGKASGKVLICPPGAKFLGERASELKRVAVLTGWAVDPSCRYRFGVDAAFPLSDHADFPDLVTFVQQVAPKQVFTLHGFAADFACTLRELGFDARALSEDEQLTLPLSLPPGLTNSSAIGFNGPCAMALLPGSGTTAPTGSMDAQSHANVRRFAGDPSASDCVAERRAVSGFLHFAKTCSAIAATPSKLEKVAVLAAYLSSLDNASLRPVTVWFTGSPFAACENKALQVGWALLRRALCRVSRVSETELHQVYLQHSDAGETAFDLLARQSLSGGTLDLEAVRQIFEDLHSARGPWAKLPRLVGVLNRCSPLEAKFLVKIVIGDLRIGLKNGLVEEAIARAFAVPVESVRSANGLLGHLGEMAELARRQELSHANSRAVSPAQIHAGVNGADRGSHLGRPHGRDWTPTAECWRGGNGGSLAGG